MKCKLSEKCEFGNLCKDATRHDSLTVLGCSSFKTKKPMTNEEYIRSCSTEELANFLEDVTSSCYHCGMTDDISQCAFQKHQCNIKEWLKEKHE